ncbi:DUF4398 domain-containing protein [Treponema pedis]|uniref:Treponemal membrane protein n=1 Tax=Treponema pedis str. T A4 TaxID=1291379 RepID=S5ZXV9_9SPIR|nr:DUF4398 domain-containing protein [Treponema pedis]AGT42808.1 treponemal membrane protein [Treponema pedis str. T A4]
MKKLAIAVILGLILLPVFAVSYDDNEYQRKSRAYTELANKSYDEGDYDAAIEYAKLAEDFARQSSEFIQLMLARTEAEQEMNKARTRFTWAKQNGAEEKYPEEYASAETALTAGSVAFDNENYDVAVVCAHKVLDALSVVKGGESSSSGSSMAKDDSMSSDSMLEELPAEYRIRTWRGERDCLWNIAGKKEVYDNPFMWKKLFDANKDKLPDASNPNWVEPGIILTIPSIRGEKRSGLYDHSKTYKSLPKK